MEGGDGQAGEKPSGGGQGELSEQELWEHLWAVARYDLRISEAEFWKLTPRALEALLARNKEALYREQTLLAILRRDLINFSFCRPKKPVELDQLLPPRGEERETSAAPDREAVLLGIRRAFGNMPGGLIVRKSGSR